MDVLIIYIAGFCIIITIAVLIYFIYRIYKELYIYVRNMGLHIKAYNDLDQLNRDIDATYSPAVLSYLYNQKIEAKKDVLSTIINLYNKDVIRIIKDSNQYKFLPKDGADISNLNDDEKYLYECCITKNEEFSIVKWEKIVRNEYDKYKFSNQKDYIDIYSNNKKTAKKSLIILLISIIITAIIGNPIAKMLKFHEGIAVLKFAICLIVFFILFITYPILAMYSNLAIYTRIRLTKKGKDEFKKWVKFKKFIKEYTLIKDRKIEEVQLYEKYIPYAMVMNINKEFNNKLIKEFIEEYNKTYKDELGPFVIEL